MNDITLSGVPRMSGVPHRPEVPYVGLMPYSEDHAPYFFGREREREIIIANLKASRLTVLYGPSGVGKSSVLRAGVHYHLRKIVLQNLAKRKKPKFAVVVFNSWHQDPITTLSDRLRETITPILRDQPAKPLTHSRSLIRILHGWSRRVGGDLLIILDQFEEYFLYHMQEKGRGTFATEFASAINCPGLCVHFLISIREDALAKLDYFKDDIPILLNNCLRIEHLDMEAAEVAIRGPIKAYNDRHNSKGEVEIEDNLVKAVLEQVKAGQVIICGAGVGVVEEKQTRENQNTQIEAPFLQMVMTRLWDEEISNGSLKLSLNTFERLGEAQCIVRTHLDNAMSGLAPERQRIAATIFNYLVTPSGTKIAHTVDDLAKYTGISKEEVAGLLEELSGPDFRILREVPPPLNRPGASGYEIFHDVLASAVLDWRTRFEQERRIEEEKRSAQEQQRKIEERARAEEKAKLAGWLRWLATGLAVMFVIAAIGWLAARQQRERAEENAAVATAEREEARRQAEAVTLEAKKAKKASRKARQAKDRADAERQRAQAQTSLALIQRAAADRERRNALLAQKRAEESEAVALENTKLAEFRLGQIETARQDAETARTKAEEKAAEAERQTGIARDALEKLKQETIAKETAQTDANQQRTRIELTNSAGVFFKEAEALSTSGNSKVAAEYYEQALKLYRQADDKAGVSKTLSGLGKTYQTMRNYTKALDYLNENYSLKESSNDPAQKAEALTEIGQLYYSNRQFENALAKYTEALGIQKVDNKARATTLYNIGRVYQFQVKPNYQEALKNYEVAEKIQDKEELRADQARTLYYIGRIYQSKPDYDEALDYYERAIKIQREIRDNAGESLTLNRIRLLQRSLGAEPKNKAFFERASRLLNTRELAN